MDTATRLSVRPLIKRDRQWRLTPGFCAVGILFLDLFLFVSDQFGWFAFDRHKGYAVLINIAVSSLAGAFTLFWLGGAILLRLNFRFTIRSLVAMTIAIVLPFSWLNAARNAAKQQEESAAKILKLGGEVVHDFDYDSTGYPTNGGAPHAPQLLLDRLGPDFFTSVVAASLFVMPRTDAGLQQLDGLPELKSLNLSSSTISYAGLRRVAALTQLRGLYAAGTNLDDTALRNLTALRQMRSLDLRETKITDAGLANLDSMQELKHLAVSDNQITDAGVEHIAKLRMLEGLSAYDTKITDVGLDQIERLDRLTDLDLSGTKITDAGLRHIDRLPALTRLFVINTGLTDDGLEGIERLPVLSSLFLGGTKITDEGLWCLGHLNQLNGLSLNATKITDAGLDHLSRMSNLQCLDLSNVPGVTDGGIQRLQHALPKCDIRR